MIAPSVPSLARALREQELTCATAESCTGGMIGAALTSLPGSSQWYRGGVIAYANEIKTALLDVPARTLAVHGAVSQPVALAMALGVCRACGADAAMATTGVAGPDGGAPDKPVGTVWIGWALSGRAVARRFLFAGDREAVRRAAVAEACAGLLDLLRGCG